MLVKIKNPLGEVVLFGVLVEASMTETAISYTLKNMGGALTLCAYDDPIPL